jgi:hypothetical protein
MGFKPTFQHSPYSTNFKFNQQFDGLGYHKPLKGPEILLQHSGDYPALLIYFIQKTEKQFTLIVALCKRLHSTPVHVHVVNE